MLGFGPLGSYPLGGLPFEMEEEIRQIQKRAQIASLVSAGLIIPEHKNTEGLLVRSYGAAWLEVVRHIGDDWTAAYEIGARAWEELLAGAFQKEGFATTLTPRSGDHGRDIIAVKGGIGSMRILGSMKAYAGDHLVTREHIHEMLGVVEAERATKGIVVTTSDFAPKILDAPRLAHNIPDRLELINGKGLHEWLKKLAASA
jgi:restriction system protein